MTILLQSPREIVLKKMDETKTEAQDKEIFKRFYRNNPVKTNRILALTSAHYDQEKTVEKAHEIESRNVMIIADNLERSIVHSRFFDDKKMHKGIYTRQLGCFVKWMYKNMSHEDVKEVWDAVGLIIENEDLKRVKENPEKV